jgi:type I restriction enzyme S subunit
MNNPKWERKPLGAVADLCLGKMLDQNKNRGDPLPYLANVNVRWGEFSLDGLRTMRFEPTEMERYGLKFGDIVMCEGGEPGRCAIWKNQVPGMMIQKAIHRIRPREDLDYRFLHYNLLHVGQSKGFDQFFTGSTIKHLPLEKLAKVEVSVPPLPIQRRIASILSAYDELIENSQRRIRILESMARALYREWFVQFRFPGHEKIALVESSLGKIPKGWEVKRIGDVFQTVLGGTPSRAKPEFWEGGTIAWINSGKVNDLRITEASELITALALDKSAAKLMPRGTTVLAITGATLGQVSYLEIETSANQSVVGIVDPSGLWSEWIYLTICERIEGIIKHASGGAQQHINKEVVNDVQVALPPDSLAEDFKRLVAPVFRELAALLFQTQNLRRTRDLLLPRLLSGQVPLD